MKEATAIILMQVFLVIFIFALVFITILTNNSKKNETHNKKHNDNCPEGCDGKKCPHGEKCMNCTEEKPECCCYDFQCEKCEEENDGVIREENEEEEPAEVPVSNEEHPYQTHSRINDIVLRKNKLIRKINKKVNNLNEEL